MRIPQLVDLSMEVVDNARAVSVVVYADDVDVAIRTSKGGGSAMLAVVNAHRTPGVCLLITAGPVAADRVLCAIAKAVSVHVHMSPSARDVIDCIIAHHHTTAEDKRLAAERFGTDVRGALLAIENGLLHMRMDCDQDDDDDDDDFLELAPGSGGRGLPPNASTWEVRAAAEAALLEWKGRDALDGRLAHIAAEFSKALAARRAL
jgi:hypothetical protein